MSTNFKHFKQADGSLKIQLTRSQIEVVKRYYEKQQLVFSRGEILSQGNSWHLIVSRGETNVPADISAVLGNVRVALAYVDRLPQLKAQVSQREEFVRSIYKSRGRTRVVVKHRGTIKGVKPILVAVNRACQAALNKDKEVNAEIQALLKKTLAVRALQEKFNKIRSA